MSDWWKKEIGYQIYPRSFMDSNHDGIGDIPGIISKLDYLQKLGITLLWISPFYKSPMADNGYDISDYYDINPEFGTIEDVEKLIEEAKKRNIKIIMDLVVNHCSDEHAMFQDALHNANSPYHDYFTFKAPVDGHEPTNWRACFGGNVWTKVPDRDEYYYHSFAVKQPDWNWENPKVREYIFNMINWWLDKGIAGFRVDAINFLKKNQDWPMGKVDGADGLAAGHFFSANQKGIEEFFTEMKEKTFEKHNCVTVAEAMGVPYDRLGTFIGDTGGFSMMFDFEYCNFDVMQGTYYKPRNWDVPFFRERLFNSQKEIQKIGWQAPFIENHDIQRSPNKFIQDPSKFTFEAKSMLAGMYFNLRGTPFIYQGQEIGMENSNRLSIDEFDDISTKNQYNRALQEGISKEDALMYCNRRSRDNARTPMQWDHSEYAGFSDHKPWLAMSGNHDRINVESQINDPHSLFNFYAKMIKIRKQEETLVEGIFKEIEDLPDCIIAYQRIYQTEEITCICNFSDTETEFKMYDGKILLNNYTDYNKVLKPYQFVMIKK